jgi:hypothetical protein
VAVHHFPKTWGNERKEKARANPHLHAIYPKTIASGLLQQSMEHLEEFWQAQVLLAQGNAESPQAHESQTHGNQLADLVYKSHGSCLAPKAVAESSPANGIQ